MLHNFSTNRQGTFLTPSSNTGFNSQINENDQSCDTSSCQSVTHEPWIDYYQGTTRIQYHTLTSFVNLYEATFGDELVPLSGHGRYIGNRTYENKYQSPLGTQLYWTEDKTSEVPGISEYLQLSSTSRIDDNGEISADIEDMKISAITWIYVHISIPGKPLNIAGTLNQLNFFYEITTDYGFNVTRIDTKVRDYSRSFTISDLTKIANKGDFSGAKSYRTYTNGRLRERNFAATDSANVSVTECAGETLYFGSPASDKQVTFYDAKYVHDVDAIDIETRWRNDRAKVCLSSILLQEDGQKVSIEEFVRNIHRVVSGSINFVHRGDDKNIDRLPMYDFWNSFRKASDGILKISSPKQILAGCRMVEWLSRQVSPTLAILSKIVGTMEFNQFIRRLVKEGTERLNREQKAFINLCMQTRNELQQMMSARLNEST